MGGRKIKVKQTAAENIAAISGYIESKEMLVTSEKFAYDFFPPECSIINLPRRSLGQWYFKSIKNLLVGPEF
jgi:hypothetical protein